MHDASWSRSPMRPVKRPCQDNGPLHANMLQLMLQGPMQAHHQLSPDRPTLDLLADFPAMAARRASSGHEKYQHTPHSAQMQVETAAEQISEHGLEINIDLEASPLPPLGWEKCLDLQTGRVYYVEWQKAARLREAPLKNTRNRDESAMLDISSTPTPENSSLVTASTSMQDLTRDEGHSPKKKKRLVRSIDLAADGSLSWLGLTLSLGVDLNSPAASPDQRHVDERAKSEEKGDGDNEDRLSESSNHSTATAKDSYGNIIYQATALHHADGVDNIATPRINGNQPRRHQVDGDHKHEDVYDSTNHHACTADDEGAQGADECMSATAMATVACTKCLMFVMVSLRDPRCPRCGTCAALDFPHQ